MLARDLLTALFLVQGALGVSVPAEARGDIAFPERNIEQAFNTDHVIRDIPDFDLETQEVEAEDGHHKKHKKGKHPKRDDDEIDVHHKKHKKGKHPKRKADEEDIDAHHKKHKKGKHPKRDGETEDTDAHKKKKGKGKKHPRTI